MMDLGLSTDQIRVALGAAKAVATADGRLDEHERDLLEAARKALGHSEPHLGIPAERVLAALERGRNVTRDLYDPSWDFWADLPLPLGEVRRKYAVAA